MGIAFRWSLAALIVLVPAARSGANAAGRAQAVAAFSALAVSPGAPSGEATLPIDITLTRWSTSDERELVTTTLLEQGPAKLLELLRGMPAVGRLTTPGSTGFELRYAIGEKVNTTDRILILTDRPVGFFEATASGRSLDYPLTVIEIALEPSGRGTGKVTVAAKIIVDRGTKRISFEDYSIWPVMLQNVRHQRP